MTSVLRCASTVVINDQSEQCDQIDGHYPTTDHHAIHQVDEQGDTETWYRADTDPDLGG